MVSRTYDGCDNINMWFIGYNSHIRGSCKRACSVWCCNGNPFCFCYWYKRIVEWDVLCIRDVMWPIVWSRTTSYVRDTNAESSACALLSGIWANTGVILSAVVQDPSISKEAGIFARFLIPGMFGSGMQQCIAKFLQTQNIIFPMLLASVTTFVLNIIMCWAMVFKSSLGLRGAAIACSVSYWFNALLLATYVKVSPSCSKTWTGFSKEAMRGTISYIKLAIPSGLMVCSETWSLGTV